MTPQFTYDSKGNAVGVFLPIEEWNRLKDSLPANSDELPQWQKDILDQRMLHLQQHPGAVMGLEDFIAEMQKEADEEV